MAKKAGDRGGVRLKRVVTASVLSIAVVLGVLSSPSLAQAAGWLGQALGCDEEPASLFVPREDLRIYTESAVPAPGIFSTQLRRASGGGCPSTSMRTRRTIPQPSRFG